MTSLQNIQNASDQANILQQALQFAHQNSLSRNQLALRAHEDNTRAYQELTSVVQLSLESLVETHVARLFQSVGRLDASLVCSTSWCHVNDTDNDKEWLTSRLILVLEQENKMAEVGFRSIPSDFC